MDRLDESQQQGIGFVDSLQPAPDTWKDHFPDGARPAAHGAAARLRDLPGSHQQPPGAGGLHPGDAAALLSARNTHG